MITSFKDYAALYSLTSTLFLYNLPEYGAIWTLKYAKISQKHSSNARA